MPQFDPRFSEAEKLRKIAEKQGFCGPCHDDGAIVTYEDCTNLHHQALLDEYEDDAAIKAAKCLTPTQLAEAGREALLLDEDA